MIDYAAKVDFSALSMEDLQAAFVQAGADLVAIENRRTDLLALMDGRKAEAKAKAAIAGMSSIEIDALRSELQVDAVIAEAPAKL